MYNGIILACHTGAGMHDEPLRMSAWEASDAVEYLIKDFLYVEKGIKLYL